MSCQYSGITCIHLQKAVCWTQRSSLVVNSAYCSCRRPGSGFQYEHLSSATGVPTPSSHTHTHAQVTKTKIFLQRKQGTDILVWINHHGTLLNRKDKLHHNVWSNLRKKKATVNTNVQTQMYMYRKRYKGRQDEMFVAISLEIQSKETLVHFIICTKNQRNFVSITAPG